MCEREREFNINTLSLIMSRFASLLRRTFGVMKEHVGTDHLGNKYYYIPEQKTWTGELKSSVTSATFLEAST